MARGSKDNRPGDVRGAELKPIRKVRRELERPDGTTVLVDVPVYPPFRLEERGEKRSAEKRGPGKRRTAGRSRKRETG